MNCRNKERTQAAMIQSTKENYLFDRYEDSYIELREPTEISLKDAIYILSLVRHSLSDDLKTVSPFHLGRVLLAPSYEFQNEITQHLYSKELIYISEKSDVNAFIFNDELTEADSYYPKMVIWNFLPGNTNEDKRNFISQLEELVSVGPWPDTWGDSKDILWKHIAKMECFEYFKHLIKQRNFEIKAFGDKTHTVFENILRNFSIGQTFNLSWQTVRDTTDYIVKEGLPKYKANNMFIGALQRKADKYLAEGWNLKHSRRDYECSQSVVSSTFFNLFLGLGDSVLETTLPK